MKPDIIAADREENMSLMEPLLIGGSSCHRNGIPDLAFGLTLQSEGFPRRIATVQGAVCASLWPHRQDRGDARNDRRGKE